MLKSRFWGPWAGFPRRRENYIFKGIKRSEHPGKDLRAVPWKMLKRMALHIALLAVAKYLACAWITASVLNLTNLVSAELTARQVSQLVLQTLAAARVAILRACYRAQTPKNPENANKYKSPTQAGPPTNEQIPTKFQNGPKIAISVIFFIFSEANLFSFFLGGGGFWVFVLCSRPA